MVSQVLPEEEEGAAAAAAVRRVSFAVRVPETEEEEVEPAVALRVKVWAELAVAARLRSWSPTGGVYSSPVMTSLPGMVDLEGTAAMERQAEAAEQVVPAQAHVRRRLAPEVTVAQEALAGIAVQAPVVPAGLHFALLQDRQMSSSAVIF